MTKVYERNGFVITRTAGPDAPWRCWHPDGVAFRADTLRDAFLAVRRRAVKSRREAWL